MSYSRVVRRSFRHGADLVLTILTSTIRRGFPLSPWVSWAKAPLDPPAVLYRQPAGKEDTILDFAAEKETFLVLGPAAG